MDVCEKEKVGEGQAFLAGETMQRSSRRLPCVAYSGTYLCAYILHVPARIFCC